MEVLNLLTMNQFLENSSKDLQNSSRMSPKILKNSPKIKFSISLHISRNSIRSEPCITPDQWMRVSAFQVYGMEHRDLWCTQCKWKKACTRDGRTRRFTRSISAFCWWIHWYTGLHDHSIYTGRAITSGTSFCWLRFESCAKLLGCYANSATFSAALSELGT